MRTFTDKEFVIFKKLTHMTDTQLFNMMLKLLHKRYSQVITDHKNYIVAVGEIPVALVAHLDTVFSYPTYDVFYDERQGVCWSPEGLGADDRSGVFAIINILQRKLRPSVILTMGEERGNVGACELAKIPCPIPDLKYMIELDRHGENDMIFYDCYCPSFINYIEGYGFLEKSGSYTDICALMDTWHICGVNLSIGFENEHDYSEILYVDAMFATINKVEQMLRDAKNIVIPFEYGTRKNILNDWYHSNSRDCDWDYEDLLTTCSMCGEQMLEFEAMYVEGNKVCENCFEKHLMEEHN